MASIDGLSSGLDTTSIIKQLMQLERQPQVRLQSRQSATEAAIQSLRGLNAKFLAIGTATAAFGAVLPKPTPPGGTPPPVTPSTKPTDWQLTKASSSDAARVSVAAVAGAAAGTLHFNVEQLAQASSHLGKTVYTGTTAKISGATTFTLTKGAGDPVVIKTQNGTLAETVAAINSAGAGVAATTVQVEPGKYQLQLTSTTTGADTAVKLFDAGVELPSTETAVGKDAVLVLTGGTTVTRSSNTISDVLDGVTLTLTKADPVTTARVSATTPPVFAVAPVSVTVAKDTDAVVGKVQALVDAINAVRTEAKTLTSADPVSKTKGRLYGDSGVRGIVDRIRTAVSGDTAGPALAGITVTRDGTVELDKSKLLAALEANPAAVETAIGKDGLAGRFHVLADAITRGTTSAQPGVITAAITSRERQVERFSDDIAGWDVRLANKEKQLQRTYTSLETALGKARSQGQWLSGQLASLPTSGNS
jgi:flagellar hook-associated protein 2